MSSNITYADDIQYVTVHKARADGHHFLLGGSILKYGDVWICSYGQGLRSENDSGSRFACKYSYDNCQTWSEEVEIAGVEGKYCRSHGVLFEYQDKVWAFCPRAAFGSVPDGTYPELIMEAYTLQTDMSWKYEGKVLDDAFWPLCEPIVLADGSILIAGLDCRNGGAAPAVALSDGDPMKWEMINIPNRSGINLWGETSVIDYGDRLVAFIRTNSGKVAVSESFDYGKTWSSLMLSDLDIANSKVYGGVLSTGSKYLIYNHGSRATMMIAVGDTDGSYGFNSMYLIRNGYVTEPNFLNNRQWAYPYAVEEDGYLYVVYAEHKENCELAIIPVSSLQVKEDEGSGSALQYESRVYAQDIVLPDHRVLCELVDGTEKWWSGDGGNGKENVSYGEISGTPVVVRKQSSKAASKGNQVLRRHFDVDLQDIDPDRLAFVITFYSSKSLSASPSSTHRLFWGDSLSRSGNDLPFSSDYTINTRLDYRASAGNLWSGVKAGWNTWFVTFNSLGYTFNVQNANSFFMIFADNSQLGEGDTIFAISSVRIIELLEEEEEPSSVTETTVAQTEVTTTSEAQETEPVDVSDEPAPPAASPAQPNSPVPAVVLGAVGAAVLTGGLAYLCYRKKHHKKGK